MNKTIRHQQILVSMRLKLNKKKINKNDVGLKEVWALCQQMKVKIPLTSICRGIHWINTGAKFCSDL